MYLFFILGLIGFYVIAFIVSGVYITIVSANVKKATDDYDSNSDLQEAYRYATIAATITWILVGLSILAILGLIVLLVFVGPEAAAAAEGAEVGEASVATGGSHRFIRLALIGTLVLMMLLNIGIGILDVLATVSLQKARANLEEGDDSLDGIYNDGIIASSIAIGSVGLLVLAFLLKLFYHWEEKARYKAKVRKEAVLRHNAEVRKRQELEKIARLRGGASA